MKPKGLPQKALLATYLTNRYSGRHCVVHDADDLLPSVNRLSSVMIFDSEFVGSHSLPELCASRRQEASATSPMFAGLAKGVPNAI
jgi:hypothetical protein